MDRDREANTRCTWFTQIGYVHGVEEFLLIVKGLHKNIGSNFPLVNVASSLEVLFLYPGVVSLTDEDAQGVPQVTELGDLSKEVTDKVSNQTSKQATWIGGLFLNWAGGFSGFLQSTRPTQEFEGQNKSIKSRMWYLLWKHKMLKMSTREQCQRYYREEKKLSISRDSAESAFSDVKKS
ncbi:hypothetical protein ACFX11_030319 [Malus domestica]